MAVLNVNGVPQRCRAGKSRGSIDAIVSSALLFILLFYDIPYYFYPEYPGRNPQDRPVPFASLLCLRLQGSIGIIAQEKRSDVPARPPFISCGAKNPGFYSVFSKGNKGVSSPIRKRGRAGADFCLQKQGRSSHATNAFATTIRTGRLQHPFRASQDRCLYNFRRIAII